MMNMADDADSVVTAKGGQMELLIKLINKQDGGSIVQISYQGE